MPSAFRGARPSHPRRACGRRAPLVLGGWMHGSPASCPGGHPRIRRPPPRRAATFSLADGTKRQFGTAQGRLSGFLGLSWPRRRPKTPGRGRPPFPRGRGHRTKPPFCATSGRNGGGATPGTRSRRVRHAPARAPLPPALRPQGDSARLRAHAGSRARPVIRHALPSKGPRHMPGPLARAIGCPARQPYDALPRSGWSSDGAAPKSRRVYSSFGLSKICSAVPSSTARPPFMTTMRSEM